MYNVYMAFLCENTRYFGGAAGETVVHNNSITQVNTTAKYNSAFAFAEFLRKNIIQEEHTNIIMK